MVFHFVICSHPALEEPVSLPPGCSTGALISSISSTGCLYGTTSSDRGSVYMFRCLCILNSRCVCTMLCFSRFISMISLLPGTTCTSSTCRPQRLGTSPQKSPGLALTHHVRHVRFGVTLLCVERGSRSSSPCTFRHVHCTYNAIRTGHLTSAISSSCSL